MTRILRGMRVSMMAVIVGLAFLPGVTGEERNMAREHQKDGRGNGRNAVRASRIVSFMLLAGFLMLPAVAWGQASAAGIAGDVRDTSGAVLPGVTVEASSPALIEKVRTVVTDAAGQYNIVQLRPGTYSITFTLPGFSTVRREGIELTTGFTATVNAEMKVGEVQETVTVTGASPVVDTANTRSQTVLGSAVLDTLPVVQTQAGWAAVTLGAVPTGRDVGGSAGDYMYALRIHGGPSNGVISYDGMSSIGMMGQGTPRMKWSPVATQEVVLATGGAGAEAEEGGVGSNYVPKEGGNIFTGLFDGTFTTKSLQNGNLSDELRTRGLSRTNAVKKIYDVGAGLGGPIRQDRLWFFASAHRNLSEQYLAGTFYNKLQGTLFYEPDVSRQGFTQHYTREHLNVRLTWQVAPKHKLTAWVVDQRSCFCNLGVGPTRAPEASWQGHFVARQIQPAWTYTASSRMLVEAAFRYGEDSVKSRHPPGTTKDDRAVFDLATGMWYGSLVNSSNPFLFTRDGWLVDYGTAPGKFYNSRVAFSYVTGSHAFKTGFNTSTGYQDWGPGNPNFDDAYQFRNRVPTGLWQIAGPGFSRTSLKMNGGAFAQDQWTLRNLTLNLGVRLDILNGYNPQQVRPGGTYVQEIRFDPIYNVPNWKDVSPRLGVAYDLFGNGKTAVKMALARYMEVIGTRIAQQTNRDGAIAGTVFRTWNDANGDYVPDCNLKSPLANGECGAMANAKFGTAIPTLAYDPDYLTGWGDRGYNWQGSIALQHELAPRVALNVGYFRTWYGNFTATDNLAVTPADYDRYCVRAPVDARLPGGGGNEVCGYDLKPQKFGLVSDLTGPAAKFGKRTQVFNGVDLGINARFGAGGLLFGGVSLGRTVFDNCLVVDSPDLRFCKTTERQDQIKFSAAYPLPWWRLVASATFQNLPGIVRGGTYVATNAQIAPSLGRNLGACGTSATCNATAVLTLVEPFTNLEPRQSQLDVRMSTSVRVGRVTLEPRLDVYNVLNASDVQALQSRYGPTYLNATSILLGRTFKFGARLEF